MNMDEIMPDQFACSDESPEILASAALTFEENLIVNDADGCARYGCIYIAYEKCCGCLIQ